MNINYINPSVFDDCFKMCVGDKSEKNQEFIQLEQLSCIYTFYLIRKNMFLFRKYKYILFNNNTKSTDDFLAIMF